MAQAAIAEARFFPVHLHKIPPHSILRFSLYVKADSAYLLFRDRDFEISADDIMRLAANGTDVLYVSDDEKGPYRQFIEDNIELILKSEETAVEEKADALYESAIGVVSDVFENPRSGETIKRSKAMVNHTVDFILSGPQAFVNLLKIRKHDFYTFAHSVNVCTFLVSLAHDLGITDQDTLKSIGEGGLLHDLGKSRIPAAIINKHGPLSPEEWDIIRKHPDYGVEIARQTRAIDDISITIIQQHHERLTGVGYPNGLAGDAMNVFARMASIVDVYDAITTNRPYSDAKNAFEAAQFLLASKEMFDSDILHLFIKMITIK
jgi:putative nucleotidyltransferase with HDIG domain